MVRCWDIAPQRRDIGTDWWGVRASWEVMYNDIVLRFDSTSTVVWVRDPNKVTLHVFCVPRNQPVSQGENLERVFDKI